MPNVWTVGLRHLTDDNLQPGATDPLPVAADCLKLPNLSDP